MDDNLNLAMRVYEAAEDFVAYLNKDYPTSLFRVNMHSHPQNSHKRQVMIECCGSTGSTEMINYSAGVNISDKNIEGRLYFPSVLNSDSRFEQAITAHLCGRGKDKQLGDICEDYIPPSERTAFEEPVSTENIDVVLATDRTILPRENVENDFARNNRA